MRTIPQLTFDITGLVKKLGLDTPAQLANEYDMRKEHVEQLQRDTWQELSREELIKLHALEQMVVSTTDPDFKLLEVKPHPIWQTFKNDRALFFLARKPDGEVPREDSETMNEMRKLTQIARCPEADAKQQRDVAKMVTKDNTILIGSPKYNEGTETAITEMLRASSTRPVTPFKYYWKNWDDVKGKRTSPFCEQATDATPAGVAIRGRDGEFMHFPLPLRREGATTGLDIGVLVAKRFSSTRGAAFTAIAIAGYSGFSTLRVAREIALGIPYVKQESFDEGKAVLRFLLCEWERIGKGGVRARRRSHWFAVEDLTKIRKIIHSHH
jgi:hypothetical protein